MNKQFSIAALFRVVDHLTGPVRQITASMNAFSASASRAGLQSQAMVHRAAAISQLRGQFGAASTAAGDLARSVRNVTLATAGLGALGAFGVKKAADGILQTSAQFEDLGAQMTTTFDGNEKAAKSAMGWVSEFARTTPYEIDEVTQSFIKLRNYGIDPIQGDQLRILGDAASAFGKPISMAVEAISDAIMLENERLKEFGVKASVDNKNAAVTYSWVQNGKQMSKTIDSTNKLLIASTLSAIWNSKFQGAMERRAKTWRGIVSNMADTWTRFQQAIGEAGFFPAMKKRLSDLYEAANRFTATTRGQGLIFDISRSLTALSDALLPSVGTLERWVFAFADWLRALDPSRIKAFAAQAFGALRQFTDWLRGITMADVASFFQDLRTVVSGLAEVFRALSVLAREAFEWTDRVTGGQGAKVLGWITAIGIVAGSAIGRLLIAVARMGPPLLRLVKWSSAVVALRVAFGGLIAWATRAGVALAGLALANPVIAAVAAGIVGVVAAAYLLWKNWDKVTGYVSQRADWLRAWLGDAWERLSDRTVQLTTVLVDDVTHRFRVLYDGVTGWAAQIYDRVTGWFTDLRMSIANIDWLGLGKDMLAKVWDGMKSIGGSIRDWVRELFDFSGMARMSGRMPWTGGAGTPKPEMAAWIDQMAGVFGANANTLRQIAYRESGYRTAAINTTDSNARKGTPSAGLFQFIEPTFNRFYDQAHRQHGAFLDKLGPKNWLNWRQQSAIAAWAFAHGKASHWSTWRGEPTTGPQSPSFALPDVAGPIGRSLKGLTMPEAPAATPESAPSAPTREPGRWMNQPLRQASGDGLRAVQVGNQIDIRLLDNRVAATTRTSGSHPSTTRVNVGINRAGKPRFRDA